jgi:transposase-like protein
MNLMDVNREFKTEEDCLEELAKVRWPEGVRCPTCGCKEISKITRKPTAKNKRTRSFQCLEKTCKFQFTATYGTMFYRSHIKLRVWFNAIAFVMDAKKGCSAMQLQRHLGLGSYESAWYMVHRIRKSMVENYPAPLTGTVEMDETYIGGRAKRIGGTARNQKRIEDKFDMVVGMKERGGRLKFAHVKTVNKKTVNNIVDANIDPNVEWIFTDSSTVYDFALRKDFEARHLSVNHSIEWVVPGTEIHINGVECEFGLFKRGLAGSFHHVSTKHLWRYLTEFSYRANLRKDGDKFGKTLKTMLEAPTMPYKELIASMPSSES